MRTPSFVSLLAAAILAGLSACGGDATAPDGLLVEATEAELLEGQTTALVASLDGESVGGADVDWISRDPSTVVVTGETARAVAPGAAWIVAQVGPLRDSVRVVVRFPALAANTVAARVAAVDGSGEHRFTLAGVALQFERTSPLWSHIHAVAGRPANADPDDIFAGDTVVSIRFPGGLALGSRALPPLDVVFESGSIGFVGDAGVFVSIEEEETNGDLFSHAFYVAVEEAAVEITSLTLPDEAGLGEGSVSGRMSFQAAGVRLRWPAEGQPAVLEPIGDRTFPVYLEFTTTLHRVPLSSGTMRIAGSPYEATVPAGGHAEITEAGLEIDQALLLDPQSEVPTYFETRVTIPAPAIGTFDLASADAASMTGFFAPFHRVPGTGAGDLGEHTDVVARPGTVTITSYRAPTETVYGELTATISATLDFGPERPDHNGTIEWSFRIPIDPLEGSVVR